MLLGNYKLHGSYLSRVDALHGEGGHFSFNSDNGVSTTTWALRGLSMRFVSWTEVAGRLACASRPVGASSFFMHLNHGSQQSTIRPLLTLVKNLVAFL
jgi:hypothetical protein